MRMEKKRLREDKFILPYSPDSPGYLKTSGISYCDGRYRVVRRRSKHTVIEYIISGSGTVKLGSQVVYPKAGDMFILPLGSAHEYYSSADDPWVKIWINAEGNIFPYLLGAYGLQDKIYFPNCNGLPFFNEIEKTYKNSRMSPFEIQSGCMLIIIKMIQFIATQMKKTPISYEATIMKHYIDANAENDISVQTLADLISRSVSQTIRIFKNEFEMTPYEYILNSKVEHAKFLLKSSNLKIKEISTRLAFADEHYFTQFFKRKVGCTPVAFREKH